MALFCWFYGLTPQEFEELTLDQHQRLSKFLIAYYKVPKG